MPSHVPITHTTISLLHRPPHLSRRSEYVNSHWRRGSPLACISATAVRPVTAAPAFLCVQPEATAVLADLPGIALCKVIWLCEGARTMGEQQVDNGLQGHCHKVAV